jgi:hypothetical protein
VQIHTLFAKQRYAQLSLDKSCYLQAYIYYRTITGRIECLKLMWTYNRQLPFSSPIQFHQLGIWYSVVASAPQFHIRAWNDFRNRCLAPTLKLSSCDAFIYNTLCSIIFKLAVTYRGCLCGQVVRVPGYRSRGPGSIPGSTRFSEK